MDDVLDAREIQKQAKKKCTHNASLLFCCKCNYKSHPYERDYLENPRDLFEEINLNHNRFFQGIYG